MIDATIKNNEVIWTGQVQVDDIYQDICCKGHEWHVATIIKSDGEPEEDWSIWGICQNPDCTDYDDRYGEDDPYRGVSQYLLINLAEILANMEEDNALEI